MSVSGICPAWMLLMFALSRGVPFHPDRELQKIVDDKDYLAALRVINNKGLLPFTNVSNAFGWKKQNYIDYVIRLLGIQDSTSEELCNIFRNYVTVGD